MTFVVSVCRAVLLVLAGLMLSGCLPSTPRDEEKEPYFLAGRSRVNAMDFKGAIECFDKALEVNPKSASAHFELGWLFDQKESDPAAAIYHYECYLKLLPNSGKEEMVKSRIQDCKQQLAQTISLAPGIEKLQRELEQLVGQNRSLQEEVERWRSCALRLQGLTNQVGGAVPATRGSSPSVTRQRTPTDATESNPISASRPVSSPAASLRRHTVKAGETPTLIARKYGVKVEALMAANAGLDPRHLRIGQALIIPAP